MATSGPRMYGYVPNEVHLYKAEDEEEHAGRKMIDFMDLNGAGVITTAEWFNFCVEHIIAEVVTFTTHSKFVQKNAVNDINKNGLANKESFSKLIDTATSIPGMYGYVPNEADLYKAEDEEEHAGRKMIDSMDFKGTDVITVDEWFKGGIENTITEAATFAACLILDHRPVPTEMFWFLLELFAESDLNNNGILFLIHLTVLLSVTVNNGTMYDGSRDVSPMGDTANDRQGPLLQREDHHDVSRDVSSSATSQHGNGGRQGAPSQHGGEGQHGAKEGGHGDEERRQEEKRSHATMRLCACAQSRKSNQ